MRVQEVFKAIAGPSRRKVLKLLQRGSQTAGELADAFEITKGSLSHHFNVLKAADLIRCERRGQQLVYSLNTTVFQDAAALLLDLFGLENGKERGNEAQSRQPAQLGPGRRRVRRRRAPLPQTA
jgi:ArsR family transcriptional regulator, arsenate/arsenite/antimonite-responsive transcriptional repressor